MKLRRDDTDDESLNEAFDDEAFDESVDENFLALPGDEVARGGDVGVTRQRLKRSRQRRSQQHRRFWQIFALCVVLFVLIVRWWSPPAPQISVAWPSKTLGSTTLPNNSTILMRGGQPFTVSIPNARQWNVRWNWVGGKGAGLPMRWAPIGSSDQLILKCRAQAVGAQVLWSWLWPTRVLVINGTSPVSQGDKRYIVVPLPGAPVRVSSRVVAVNESRWHENALPLLESAARHKSLKNGASWTIVSSSDGKTPARDDSTYVALSENSFANPATALAQTARHIETLSPKTDIKWVARLNPVSNTPRAILWLDFEKRRKVGARGGWIVENGNGVAQPTKWWKSQ